MPDPGDISEDRGFKALFTAYPRETVEVFVPELLAIHGPPVAVAPLPQELPPQDLSDPSRFLDMALLATWADGTQSVILLVEHWSEARKVRLRRVHLYHATLAEQHPTAEVFPLVLVTDPGAGPVPDRLVSIVAGLPVLDFRVRVVRIKAEDLPRLRSLQNRVAAVLMALAIVDVVEAVVTAMAAMKQASATVDDLRRFLPLVRKLARMKESDEPRFRHRMREEPDMSNILDEMLDQGRAEGAIRAIRDLVAGGVLPISAARAEIEKLIAQGVIPEAAGREAITRLG